MTAELNVRSDVKCKALVSALGVPYSYSYSRFVWYNVIELPTLTQDYADALYNKATEVST